MPIERFIEAKLVNERLRNRESVHALDKARNVLVEVFAERRSSREAA
jgi:hypothetical protein